MSEFASAVMAIYSPLTIVLAFVGIPMLLAPVKSMRSVIRLMVYGVAFVGSGLYDLLRFFEG